MPTWFEQYPGRLEFEFQALRGAGYKFSLDEKQKAAGRIVLYVEYPIEVTSHTLTALFPDLYPYFPVEIFAPTFPDGRHKHPHNGLLCTLQDPHENWHTDDTLAGFLGTQVKVILEAHLNPGGADGREAHEGAQASGYYTYQPMTAVLTGDWSIPPDRQHGRLVIGIEPYSDPNQMLRGVVLEVQDENGQSLAHIDPTIAARHREKLTARWVRLATPPPDGNKILDSAVAIWPEVNIPRFKHGPDIVGLLIPEEAGYLEPTENWVFVVRTKERGSRNIQGYLARADRFSRQDIQSRIPKLAPLATKKILIVGLGAVGATCALQLARAGVASINLMDFDHVQIGNLPRWQLGYSAIGRPKVEVLASFIAQEYPLVSVKDYLHRLGSGHDNQVLSSALENVDLILDATAEWCVSHYLSDTAKRLEIPYVWATGTPGSYGGIVGRIVPGETEGCWKCFQNHVNDKTIAAPHQDLAPGVQPVGCFHPTFTGTGFDMDHVALAAVRLVASTLCEGNKNGYPDFNWDVGVLNLWDDGDQPIASTWVTYPLRRHENCHCHDKSAI